MTRDSLLCPFAALWLALLLAGCVDGESNPGGDLPPPPPPDPTQRMGTGFEAIVPGPDGSFAVGQRPMQARFSGGQLKQSRLAHTGDWAWIVEEGGSATIEFPTPLSELVLWFTNESEARIVVEPDPDSNVKPVCGIDDQGLDNSQYFGVPIFARGAFNDWGNSGLDPQYQFYNFGDEIFQAEIEFEEAATYEFKIADGGWSIEYGNPDVDFTLDTLVEMSGGAALGGANSRLVIPEPGCYNFLMTLGEDLSMPPPVATLLMTEIEIDPGDAALARSFVRVYDDRGELIAEFEGLDEFQRIEILRNSGQSRIRRIEIVSLPGGEGTTGIGEVAIDDLRFGALPDTTPRPLSIFYTKPDGNYANTEIEVTLGNGSTSRQACTPTTTSAFGCVVQIEAVPGFEVTYTVFNGGVADAGSPIRFEVVDALDGNVYTFANSDVPLLSDLPALPLDDNEVVLYYLRPDGDYDGWGLHLFRVDGEDWTVFEQGEYPFAGIDEDFGAYFIIALPGSERLTAPYSNDPAPLEAFPDTLGVVVHNGPLKDPSQDLSLRIAQDGNVVFVTAGVVSIATTPPIPGAVNIVGAAAHWVADDTLLWDAAAASEVTSVKLLHSASASILAAGTKLIGADGEFELTAGGSNPFAAASGDHRHLAGIAAWTLPPEAVAAAKSLAREQLVAVGFDAAGRRVAATAVQIPLLLDDLYASAAQNIELGASFLGTTPRVRLWAPTANSVALNLYDDPASDTPIDTVDMTFDEATGVWSAQGTAAWDRLYYTFAVNVFAPSAGEVVDNVVTDPYSLSLSTGSALGRIAKSQIVNLADADLQPAGWTDLAKPPLAAPEDIALYELHVRDFSIWDDGVPAADRGKYTAFAGAGSGVAHLSAMADAGLTHVHILPSFDIATINEDAAQRVEITAPVENLCALVSAAAPLCADYPGMTIEQVMAAEPGGSDLPQQIVTWMRDLDGFNWGYDPFHYTVPEGSYSTNPDGPARIREFRTMVKGLTDIGLRTVMDVVYNHTNAAGNLSDRSVLDRIVPGYYHRQSEFSGAVLSDSCCPDTATEHAMMEKLMLDSLVTWARHYKVDGFRFDIMGFHSLQTLTRARNRLQSLTVANDGVDGSKIYLYGEGWNFGDVGNDRRFRQATQRNVAGTGIGTFNDRLRDAVRGGGPFDVGVAHERNQGFMSGQYYDPNAQNSGSALELGALLGSSDLIRLSMAGNLDNFVLVNGAGDTLRGDEVFYNGQMAGYTRDPQEIINYVASHDGETLWDIAAFKHPVATSTADRVRAHNVANAVVVLGQGIPFLHAGQDMLRSKSMDRNSYNSGDWFNRLDFTYADNNFAVGTPPHPDNQGSLAAIRDVLQIAAADADSASIQAAVAHAREMLEIRKGSRLFRLRTAQEILDRVSYHNTGPNQVPGLIVQSIDDGEQCSGSDLDDAWARVVTLVNASVTDQTFALFSTADFALHPVLAAAADPVVRTANHSTDGFFVPARTAAVFVEAETATDCGALGREVYLLGSFNNFLAADTNRFDLVSADIADVTVDLAAQLHFFRVADDARGVVNCGAAVSGTAVALNQPFTLYCAADSKDLQLDLRSADAGDYVFRLDATDPAAPTVTVTSAALDTMAPIVAVTAPAADAIVAGNVVIRATATDDVAVTVARFYVDDLLIGSDTTATGNEYSLTWNSTTTADGPHALRVEAEDSSGNVGVSGTVTVTVDSTLLDDNSPPVVTLDPVPATVTGTVALSAQASDPQGGNETPTGVVEVRFYYSAGGSGDPTLIDSATSEPYTINWDTTGVANGSYQITAEAVDGAGNLAQSDPQTTSVDNPGTYGADLFVCGAFAACDTPPSPDAQLVFAGNDRFAGTLTLVGSTLYSLRIVDSDGATVGGTLDCGAPNQYTPIVPNAPFALDCAAGSTDALLDLSQEGAAGDYRFELDATDPANPVLTVIPDTGAPNVGAGDVTPPSVEISGVTPGPEPLAGDQVVEALASDVESDLLRVDFFVGGELLGSDATAPYQAPWNTLIVANGNHDLTATAVDAAGNSATSAPVTVSVDNVGPYGVDMYVRGSWDLQFDVLPGQAPMDYLGSGLFRDVMPDGLIGDDGNPSEIGNSTVRFKITSDDVNDLVNDCNPPVDNTPTVLGVPVGFECGASPGNAKFDVSLEDPVDYVFEMDASRGTLEPQVTVTRADPPPPPTGTDTTAPTFLSNLTIDPPDDPVSFGITINATVTDDNVVARVEFQIDNEIVWVDFTDPFQAPWDSQLVENGVHTITALAFDADGNVGSAAPLTVTVDNPDFGPFGVEMFVRGAFTDDDDINFDPIHPLVLLEEGGTIYEAIVPIDRTTVAPTEFSIGFKVADAGWTDTTNCGRTTADTAALFLDTPRTMICSQAQNGDGTVPSQNISLFLIGQPQPANYKFTVDATDYTPENPSAVVTVTLEP